MQVACQVIHVELQRGRTWVDLVTLEPCDRGRVRLPAGAPLALGFDSAHGGFLTQLEAVMSHWESDGAVLDLEVDDARGGLSYQFSCGDEHLTVLVDSSR
jgi:hypothetical protein